MSAVAQQLPAEDEEAGEVERLLEFLYVCPVGLAEIDGTGAIGMINPLAMQILFPLAAGRGVANLFQTLEPYAPDLRSVLAGHSEPRGVVFENRRIHVRSLEDERPLILSSSLIRIEADRYMAVLSDVSEQVLQERKLKQAESWFSMLMSGVNDFALLSLDKNGRINSWNRSGERQTGYGKAEMLGRTMNVFYFPEEAVQGRALQQVDLARRDGWHIDEGWRRRKDGTRYWCQSLVSALEASTGEVAGFSVVLRDVTERKRDGDEIRRLLTTDHLTGVSNRARFFDLAEAEIGRWRRFGQPLSALMCDIDHFKRINDLHGHAAGDEVLKGLGRMLQGTLRAIDVCGRMGGEEFAILLPSIDLEGARLVAERLRDQAGRLRPVVDGTAIELTVSIGCATMDGRTDGINALLKGADLALYAAKTGGRNRVELRPPSGEA